MKRFLLFVFLMLSVHSYELIHAVTPMLLCSPSFEGGKFESLSLKGSAIFVPETKTDNAGYQTVYSNRKAYFKTNFGTIETLRIDSAECQGDTILYPMRTMQLVGNDCYEADGGGFAGKKIIIGKAWNYYFNEVGDTIRIKTNARLSESWTMFHRPDITVLATVTAWDTLSVLGVPDSVKTITLHVYDLTMKPLPHQLEGKNLLISKNFGWVKMPNIIYFPLDRYHLNWLISSEQTLAGIINPKMGVQNLTWFEVNDFQVGDEFHYESYFSYLMSGGDAGDEKKILKILYREDSQNYIKYVIDVKRLFNHYTSGFSVPETIFEHYTDSQIIRPDLSFEIEPGIPLWTEDSTVIGIFRVFGFNRYDIPTIYHLYEKCWFKSEVIDDACNYISYDKGRGLVKKSGGCFMEFGQDETKQVYYKKGDKTWGVPLVLTDILKPEDKSVVKVFPNPVTDYFYIDLASNTADCYIRLFDINGLLIRKFQLQEAENQLNLMNLSEGMYLYQIEMDGITVKNGKLIKLTKHQ
jgi:hypothetical protein